MVASRYGFMAVVRLRTLFEKKVSFTVLRKREKGKIDFELQ